MKGAEGRNEPYSFLVQYCRRPPQVVVYDFACALQEYCLNRAPAFFKDTLFVVDRFHWRNHVACAFSYNMSGFLFLDQLNSQAAEQSNSRLQALADVCSLMTQPNFMRSLRFFFGAQNATVASRLSRLLAHMQAIRSAT